MKIVILVSTYFNIWHDFDSSKWHDWNSSKSHDLNSYLGIYIKQHLNSDNIHMILLKCFIEWHLYNQSLFTQFIYNLSNFVKTKQGSVKIKHKTAIIVTWLSTNGIVCLKKVSMVRQLTTVITNWTNILRKYMKF